MEYGYYYNLYIISLSQWKICTCMELSIKEIKKIKIKIKHSEIMDRHLLSIFLLLVLVTTNIRKGQIVLCTLGVSIRSDEIDGMLYQENSLQTHLSLSLSHKLRPG